MTYMVHCSNCGTVIKDKYCPHCGQEKITGKLSMKNVATDISHGMFHWDSSMFKTVKALVLRPGHFINSYIEGKRKPYVKPFSYFIFIQTVYVLLFHWMSGKFFAFVNVSFTGTQLTKIEEMQRLLSSNMNYLNFVLPLILAFFLMLFLKKKKGVNYAEALVFSLYTIGTTLIFSMLLMLPALLTVELWNLRFPVVIIYLTFAITQFAGYKNVWSVIRSLIITILSYLVFIVLIGVSTFFFMKYVMKINL